ncbi:hypothetical protein RJ640_030910 [Escallonia rubra]|uniref:WW domain-containing protein n=1 Tax=Escallonia rubra TaxID=112253 RepID=A0AA88RPA4_9ASTE|nr:hypothetical protein RJ640_030910 [Escallonia rubra]
MTSPNMATITASLERSLQNCSLNHHRGKSGSNSSSIGSSGSGVGFGRSDSPENHLSSTSDATLELNSQISLPYHWEQCLDLKTGEVYYINWRTGMKVKEDPRTSAGDFYESEEEEEEEEDGDDESESECESESEGESPWETSDSSSREQQHVEYHRYGHQYQNSSHKVDEKGHVLVVAGCKSCLMYFMVPKQVADCPKCTGQLLHFDRSENASP